MRTLILISALLAALLANAQAPRHFYWANSPDSASVVHAYLPDPAKATGRAIVDCPGGAYITLAVDHEGHQWADFYNDLGIAYFVLVYRLPAGDASLPVGDAQRAIRTVREHADEWGIDPANVGIMGFSAGGHLASTVATHSQPNAMPNFQILFYPVITFGEGTHRGSRDNLLGQRCNDAEAIRLYSNELQAGPATPPAIVLLSSDDTVVPPLPNGVAYYQALVASGVPASLIAFPTGGHGWGFNPDFAYHADVLQTLATWLANLR